MGQIDNAGEEDALDPSLKEIQDMAVGHLHRVAGLRRQGLHALVNHLLVGLLRVDHGKAQLLEEAPEEGHEFLEEQGPGNPQRAPLPFRRDLGTIEQILPLLHQVG